jgi:Fe-S-cluster containining protein
MGTKEQLMTPNNPLHEHVETYDSILQGAILALQIALNENQEDNIGQCMDFFWMEIDRYYQAISSFSEFSCQRGCSFCCFDNPHGVSGIELQRLLPLLDEHQKKEIQAFKVRYDKIDASTEEDRQLQWKKACRPCPLLNGTQCSVYSKRPLACRSFFSIHQAQWCHPVHPSYQEQPQIGNDHLHSLMNEISRKEGLIGTTDLLSGLAQLLEEG